MRAAVAGRVRSMAGHFARGDSRARSHWWSGLLSVLVALSLVVQPSLVCALVESSSHAHSGAHAHSHSHPHGSEHSHDAGSSHEHHSHGHHRHGHHSHGHHNHEHHDDDGRMSLFEPGPAHSCCSTNSAPRLVAAPVSRSFETDKSTSIVLFTPAAILPAQDIFALTACHGRDGPPGRLLRSQCLLTSLLGRAPPVLA